MKDKTTIEERVAELEEKVADLEARLRKALICANVPVGTPQASWVAALEDAWRYATGDKK